MFLDWPYSTSALYEPATRPTSTHGTPSTTGTFATTLRGFPLWSMASKLTRPLRLPAPAILRNATLPQRERMAPLGRLLTATNPHSRWLFPGRRAGQPMHSESLAALINHLGVPTTTARTAAIHQHLLEMPAPIVADALGSHPVIAAKITSHTGATWSRYAPSDHARTGDC
jgi:hypothetical protein